MKKNFLSKKGILSRSAVLGMICLFNSTSFAGGGGDVGSVILKNETQYGYACTVNPKSIVINGSAENQAYKRLSLLRNVTIYSEKTLLSGQLQPVSEGSLEFKPVNTLVSLDIKGSSSQILSTVQNVFVLDKSGRPILTEDQLSEVFFVKYNHTSIQTKQNGEINSLEVSVSDKHWVDHKKNIKAYIKSIYKAPTNLPENAQQSLNGSVEFTLNCQSRN